MTQEEKAKAYDEALERARKCLDENRDTCFVRPDIIFHELAESEDEKIRKALIQGFNECLDSSSHYPKNAIKYWHGIVIEDIIAWLEKQDKQKSVLDELEMTLSVSEDAYLRSNIEKLIKEFKNDTKKTKLVEIDGFDAELNALLKKYEYLSKKELQEPLEFYLGVVRDDLDVVREEEKPKWTEEDEAHLHSVTTHLEQWIERHPNTCGADIQGENLAWLSSLKQRMEEQE